MITKNRFQPIKVIINFLFMNNIKILIQETDNDLYRLKSIFHNDTVSFKF